MVLLLRLLLSLTAFSPFASAFPMTTPWTRSSKNFYIHQQHSDSSLMPLHQSTRPNESTEDVILQAAERKRLGLRQEYGLTIKKDGLDPLRRVVWGLFDVSQVVFTGLGAMLAMGLLLNIMGYGYYLDDQGNFIIQTLDEIRRNNMMDAELLRLSQTLDSANVLK